MRVILWDVLLYHLILPSFGKAYQFVKLSGLACVTTELDGRSPGQKGEIVEEQQRQEKA
jgi:hypothetical protein